MAKVFSIKEVQVMKKNILAFFIGIIVGICVGVALVFPGMYAYFHQLNFFEVWFNMFIPIV